MINRLEEEENQKKTLKEKWKKHENQENTELKKLRQEEVQGTASQSLYSSKAQENMRITKPFDVIADDVYRGCRVGQEVC